MAKRFRSRTLNTIWNVPGGWIVVVILFILTTPLNIAQFLSQERFWRDWWYELTELWKAGGQTRG